MLLFFLVLSLVVNIVCFFGVMNLIKQNERLEDYFESLQQAIVTTIAQMKSIDIRGAFEADDEVGLVFKGMLNMVASLNTFLAKGDYEEKSSTKVEE